jgi:hypothetical protein
MRIKATKQLNGVVRNYNAIVSRICLDWNAATSTWIERETQNPASIMRWALQSGVTAKPRTDAQIDIAQLQAWHVICAAKGWNYNRVHDFDSGLWDVLADITNDFNERERLIPWPGHVGPIDVTEALEFPGKTNPAEIWKEARWRQYEPIERGDALRFEQQQLGRTAREQEIYNQLQAAGVTITSANGQAIAALTGDLYDQQQAMQDSIGRMDEVRSGFKDFVGPLVEATRKGESVLDALGNSFDRLSARIQDNAISTLTDAMFGKQGEAGNGMFGSMFGNLFAGGTAVGAGAVGSTAGLTGAGLFHSGGVVGANDNMRLDNAAAYANAPRLHRGGGFGLAANERRAILQTGERVLSRNETRAVASPA